MPRQTRSRVASSRHGEASSSSATKPAPAKTTPQAPPIRSDSTDIYGVSDREVEYQRNKKQAAAADQSAADGAVDQLTTTTVATRQSTRGRTPVAANTLDAVALQTSRKRRDAAMDKLANLTSTTDDAADSPAANNSPATELGRKDHGAMEASSLLGPRARGSLSGMEIMDDEIFGNLDSSFDMTGHDDGNKGGASTDGTRSADTSAFSVSAFRRPTRSRRGSSIVGKGDAPIRPSSRAPTTPGLSSNFSMGNFRRRRRQPSILMSSAQKASLGLQRTRDADETDDNDNDNDEAVASGGEEESFLPEAEGTPVRPSQGRRSTLYNKENDEEESSELSDLEDAVEAEAEPATRSRKRKSTDAHESEAAKRQAVEAEENQDEMQASIGLDEGSSPPSFVERRHRTPELDSDILAPPASSSSQEGSPTIWPSLRDLGKKSHRQAPARARKAELVEDDAMSDISEPPSLTHSPNFKATKPAAAKKTKKQCKESPMLSTADLEALLPRRRRRVPRDGDADDIYGLSDSDHQERPRPTKPRAAKKATAAQPLHGNSKANQTNNQKQAKNNTSAPAKRPTRRKYGSRHFGKENTAEGDSIEVAGEAAEPLDDTAFEADVTEERSSQDLAEELKAASRKFKEVDKWELDFEEVVEPSSDLPEGR